MTTIMTASVDPENNGLPAAGSRRRCRRVGVKLRVAIVLGRDTEYLAHTSNMSESGLLVEDYSGPPLKPGRLVGVNLRGVVSDGVEEDSQQYLMRVVRQNGSHLALKFTEGD